MFLFMKYNDANLESLLFIVGIAQMIVFASNGRFQLLIVLIFRTQPSHVEINEEMQIVSAIDSSRQIRLGTICAAFN